MLGGSFRNFAPPLCPLPGSLHTCIYSFFSVNVGTRSFRSFSLCRGADDEASGLSENRRAIGFSLSLFILFFYSDKEIIFSFVEINNPP